MALTTPAHYNHLVLYEVFVRNHSGNGHFRDVQTDLPRIKALGVDFVWLMPIHPIGTVARKGTLGSPYSIADYRELNKEYGTLSDFQALVDEAHRLGLKVMIDLVFNHVAHDSRLARQQPSWCRLDEEGVPYCTVSDWSDVVDLNHNAAGLREELLDVVEYWVRRGVDGFRCDVASLVPLDVWRACRERADQIKADVMWLAESVDAHWVAQRRSQGFPTLSDGELYEAFDITYDYDIWALWQATVTGRAPVKPYVEALRFQDCRYPENYIKLRAVENHDKHRINALAPGPAQARAWTAFQAFNKGAFLIYAGQEAGSKTTPSLFDRDPINWESYGEQEFLSSLCRLRRHSWRQAGIFHFLMDHPALMAAWSTEEGSLVGIFNVSGKTAPIDVPLPDGQYRDLLSGRPVQVRQGQMAVPAEAMIIEVSPRLDDPPPRSLLLDFRL
jgi:glycosidase